MQTTDENTKKPPMPEEDYLKQPEANVAGTVDRDVDKPNPKEQPKESDEVEKMRADNAKQLEQDTKDNDKGDALDEEQVPLQKEKIENMQRNDVGEYQHDKEPMEEAEKHRAEDRAAFSKEEEHGERVTGEQHKKLDSNTKPGVDE